MYVQTYKHTLYVLLNNFINNEIYIMIIIVFLFNNYIIQVNLTYTDFGLWINDHKLIYVLKFDMISYSS